MSKAAVRKNQADILNQMKKERKDLFAQRRQITSGTGSVNFGNVTTNNIGVSTGDTNVGVSLFDGLSKGGGTMEGPIAFKPNSITISGNKLTMANLLTTPTSWCIATGESSAADDLDYIITQNIGSDVGAWYEGQILILQAGVYNITLKHNTGNIFIPSGSDVTLNGYTSGGGGSGGDIAVLIFDNQVVDTSSGKWVLVSTSTASGGGSGFVNPATTDLDMNTWDIIDICAIKFDNADGTELNSTDYGMEVYGNDLRYNIYGGVSTNDNSHAFRVENSTKFEIYEEYLLSWNDIRINSTKIIKSNSTSVGIGIYVSDASVLGVPSTKGTMGTLEGPYDSSTAYPATQGALDTLFGNSPGSIGVYEDTDGTSSYKGRLYYRSTDGWHIITGTKV